MKLNLLLTLFLGLIFTPPAYSQEDDEAYRERILREYSKKPAPQETTEVDRVIEEDNYEEERPEIIEPVAPVKIEDSFISKIMNNASKKFIGRFLKQNPFSNMSKSELQSLVLSRLEGQPFGDFLKEKPKFLDMFIDILRDRRALPSLLSLVNKPEKVKKYGMILIGVFVSVFFLNLFNSKGNIFRRILVKMCIGIAAFSANIISFYVIFKDELTPTLDIVLKYYHL
ncbi:MAG: hypothetical protein CME64_09230 [Halobacteriovoraceae bacterium]|nr:hypothetical protein [Halobacteriovoraceae bacterium]|tara:strand:+ start:42673 stop:43353 length:681 start_codon:yes stop_codon:yes gene_type:complete